MNDRIKELFESERKNLQMSELQRAKIKVLDKSKGRLLNICRHFETFGGRQVNMYDNYSDKMIFDSNFDPAIFIGVSGETALAYVTAPAGMSLSTRTAKLSVSDVLRVAPMATACSAWVCKNEEDLVEAITRCAARVSNMRLKSQESS